jgi:serine/threonine-protein kinase
LDAGGDPKVLTRPEAGKDAAQPPAVGTTPEGDHLFPSLLPGGRGVLFTIWGGSPDTSEIAVLDLKSGQRKTLLRGGTSAEYVSTGHLVYAVAGALRAVPFDLNRLEVVGDSAPVIEPVPIATSGAANFALSRSGTRAYVSGDTAVAQRSLVWVDRQGREEAVGAPARAYALARVAPDGVRIAVSAADQDSDIWIWDTRRRTLTRLTFDSSIDTGPLWTADGSRIIFSANRGGTNNLFWRRADGTGTDERLTSGVSSQYPTAITRDGSTILGMTSDIMRWKIDAGQRRSGERSDGGSSPPEPLLRTPFREANPALSPDERYVAYQSNESGRFEVYVRPYPNINDGRWQVSTGGGTRPLWAPNGRELFYVGEDGSLMAVPVQTSGATFSAGSPTQIIKTPYADAAPLLDRSYDIAPDGKRFLMIKDVAGDTSTPVGIVVVQNWVEELKRAFPTSAR